MTVRQVVRAMPLVCGLLACDLSTPTNQTPAQLPPPYWGTIFLDPDIIVAGDSTTYSGITPNGQGIRTMFDRRVNGWTQVNAHLFDATYNDGLAIEVQVNPEFSAAAAEVEANKYALVIGRLPRALRVSVATVWIHQGTQPFGGGNNNILIHVGQSALYEADGILEETLVHEAAHTSLDAFVAPSAGWIAAQKADNRFISTYARDNPTREDVAESVLPWLMIRYRPERISQAIEDTIKATMPNRIAFFDALALNMLPIQ